MESQSLMFTSESVSEGHPDKVADQISDAVLDSILEQDTQARVACETMVTTGMTVVAVPSPITQSLDFSQADRVVAGLENVTLEWIESLAKI